LLTNHTCGCEFRHIHLELDWYQTQSNVFMCLKIIHQWNDNQEVINFFDYNIYLKFELTNSRDYKVKELICQIVIYTYSVYPEF
jgi:hypothetical protein